VQHCIYTVAFATQLPGRYDYVRAPVRLVSGNGTHKLMVSDIGSDVGKDIKGMHRGGPLRAAVKRKRHVYHVVSAAAKLSHNLFEDYMAMNGSTVLGGGSVYYDTLDNYFHGVTFWLSQVFT
jgi:hypothetical protein